MTNGLALARMGGLHVFHGGRHDGFGWLLLGLAAIALVAWLCSRSGETASSKD
jgi:hypothetical protein